MRAKPKRSVKGILGVLGRRTLRVLSSKEHKDLEEKTSIEQEVKLESYPVWTLRIYSTGGYVSLSEY